MAKPLRPEFNAERHEYRLDGEIIPGVSSITGPLKNMAGIPPKVLANARDRGHAVHRACELYDRGRLDVDSVDEIIVPYLAAWCQFMADWEMLWTLIEVPLAHPVLRYGGTPDRGGYTSIRETDGKRYDCGIPYTVGVDAKATYDLDPAVEAQLNGYDLMQDKPWDELWSVRLKKDGTYVRTVHPRNHGLFLSCYNIYHWKRKNRLTH